MLEAVSAFKAYDIRGIVPSELDTDTARKIGHAFARRIEARRLLVGQDMRTHSPEVAGAVVDVGPACDVGVPSVELTTAE